MDHSANHPGIANLRDHSILRLALRTSTRSSVSADLVHSPASAVSISVVFRTVHALLSSFAGHATLGGVRG